LEQLTDSRKLINTWEESLSFMNRTDSSFLLGEFFRTNDVRDEIRNENFESVFPEYKDLRQFVHLTMNK